MWWKCDVKFFRTILQLKVWARNELEARTKVERMYQVATIQHLTPAGGNAISPCATALPESAADQFRRFQSQEHRQLDCQS